MDNSYCTGAENNLTDCRFDGWGVNDCHESEAAGVVCSDGPISRLSPIFEAPTTTSTTPSPTTVASINEPAGIRRVSVGKKLQQDMAPRRSIKVYNLVTHCVSWNILSRFHLDFDHLNHRGDVAS